MESKIASLEERNRSLFTEEFKVGVYRIVEEALGNVVKHSRAAKAEVSLSYREDGRISLEITDDGVGFEPADNLLGFGLTAIKEYAATLGGPIRFDSAPGRGTTIRVILPAREAPERH